MLHKCCEERVLLSIYFKKHIPHLQKITKLFQWFCTDIVELDFHVEVQEPLTLYYTLHYIYALSMLLSKPTNTDPTHDLCIDHVLTTEPQEKNDVRFWT